MPLAGEFKDLLAERARSDPEFRRITLERSAGNLLNGELYDAALALRTVVAGGVGFEALAEALGGSPAEWERTLGPDGPHTAGDLRAVVEHVGRADGLSFEVTGVQAAQAEAVPA